ncbi:hypothetical protein FOA52_006126 [Chlamydomonas sp. UWO 241]|nr:hypothetical protein FOA52_006126 [Chlamydomonas sp. UWO 241]
MTPQEQAENDARAAATLTLARRKVELLEEQAELVMQLERYTKEQDELVLRLEQEIEEASRRQGGRQEEYEARLAELEEALAETKPPPAGENFAKVSVALAEKDEALAQLRARMEDAEARTAELRAQAEAARAEVKEAAAKLGVANAWIETAMKEQEKQGALQQAKQLPRGKRKRGAAAAGGNAAAGAGPGAASEPFVPDADLATMQFQAMLLKTSLDEANAEVAELTRTSSPKVEAAASAVANLAKLQASFEAQMAELVGASKEAETLAAQLEEAKARVRGARDQARSGTAREDAELASRLSSLQNQLSEVRSASEAASASKATLEPSAQVAEGALDALRQECDELEAARRESKAHAKELDEELANRKSDPMGSFKESLKSMGEGMDEAIGLRSDLQVLAEAFQSKEAEASKLAKRAKGQAVRLTELAAAIATSEAQTAAAVAAAEAATKQADALDAELADLTPNDERLGAQNRSLEEGVREQTAVSKSSEEKALALESNLVALSEEIMALKGQLSATEHTLTEAGARLRQLAAEEAMAVEERARLEPETAAQKVAVAEASERLGELEAEYAEVSSRVAVLHDNERALKATSSALAAAERELAEAMRSHAGAQAETQVLADSDTKAANTLRELGDALNVEGATHDRRMGELNVELQAERAKAAALRAAAQERAGGLSEAELRAQVVASAALRQANTAVAELQLELETWEQARRDAEAREGAARAQLRGLTESYEQAQRDVASARAQLEDLSGAAAQAVASASNARGRTTTLREQLESEKARTRDVLAQAEAYVFAIEEARREASPATAEYAELNDMYERVGARMGTARGESARLEKQVEELNQQLQAARAEREFSDATNHRAIQAAQLAAQTELDALHRRVADLDAAAAYKDSQLAQLAGDPAGEADEVATAAQQRLVELQAENLGLRGAAAEQDQLLAQARAFLKSRMGAQLGGDK